MYGSQHVWTSRIERVVGNPGSARQPGGAGRSTPGNPTQHGPGRPSAPLTDKPIHPILVTMRDLRRESGMSLNDMEVRHGISGVALGSYERGDRMPPLSKAEAILNCFGYTLTAVPMSQKALRLPDDMVTELRAIADQMEAKQNALMSRLPDATPFTN